MFISLSLITTSLPLPFLLCWNDFDRARPSMISAPDSRQLAASEKELYHDACVASRFLVSAEIASHAALGKSRRKGDQGTKRRGVRENRVSKGRICFFHASKSHLSLSFLSMYS